MREEAFLNNIVSTILKYIIHILNLYVHFQDEKYSTNSEFTIAQSLHQIM